MQIYENVRPPSCEGRRGNSGSIPIAQSDITGDLAFRFFFLTVCGSGEIGKRLWVRVPSSALVMNRRIF